MQAHAVMSEVPLAQLTLPQLHQLADAWPDAKSSNHWIAAVVLKMYPQQPVGQASVAQRSMFLDRVQQFCDSLPLEVAFQVTPVQKLLKFYSVYDWSDHHMVASDNGGPVSICCCRAAGCVCVCCKHACSCLRTLTLRKPGSSRNMSIAAAT